jgi:hypothetical protein
MLVVEPFLSFLWLWQNGNSQNKDDIEGLGQLALGWHRESRAPQSSELGMGRKLGLETPS